MFYGSKEAQEKEARERAAEYREAAGFFPAVVKVLNAFAGKVYNCKLDKETRAATNNKVRAEYKYNCITLYTWNRGRQTTIASYKPEESDKTPAGKVRINAAALIASARECREKSLKEAAEIENAIETAPQVLEYIKQCKEKLEALTRRFPSEIRDIYNLPYSIRLN